MPTGKSYCVLHAKQAGGNAEIYTRSKSERWPLGGATYSPQISSSLI
jgi:hypothetical protein